MQPANPVTSYIGRWVAFALTPLILAAVAWLGTHGIDLDPASTVAAVLGIAASITTWLYNRGKFEAAKASGIDEAAIERIIESVVETKLPKAPQAPIAGLPGAPAQPQAPPPQP